MNPRITAAAAGTLLLLAALSACSGTPEASATSTPKATPTVSATTDPVQTEETEEPVVEPACDTIVSPGTVQALTDAGWSFEAKPFVVGDVMLEEGLLCFWADYTIASDHGQLYGWSEITPEDAAQAQTSLLGEGWTREDGSDGIYITENPQFAMGTDEDGYGMTYLFGDGWVKFADTRQGLILIDWAT